MYSDRNRANRLFLYTLLGLPFVPPTHFIVQKKIGNHLPSSIEWPKARRKVINLSQKNLSKKFIAPPSGAIKRREPVHTSYTSPSAKNPSKNIYSYTSPPTFTTDNLVCGILLSYNFNFSLTG